MNPIWHITKIDYNRKIIYIEDMGYPWLRHKSITNDPDFVLTDLYVKSYIDYGWKVYYYDSEGNLDQICFDNFFMFTCFAPVDPITYMKKKKNENN